MQRTRPTPCRGKGDLFFSEKEEDERRAVAHCEVCWDKPACRRRAREQREEYGTWGGETASARRTFLQIVVPQEPRQYVSPVRITEAIRDEVIQLRARGVRPKDICQKFGLTKDQVSGILARSKKPRKYTQMREADKELAIKLYKEGQSVTAIAARVGRSNTAILDLLERAGLRKPRPAFTREQKRELGKRFAVELGSGTSVAVLADREKVNQQSVINWARQYGGWTGGKKAKAKVSIQVVDD